MKKRINLIFLIVCIILTIPALVGIFHPGFFLSDDGNWMVIRFSAFYEALRNGQFPVRFLPRLNNGYGYPVADFLYPLFMYLAVPIHILKFNFVDTIKIILGLSIILSSVFTFFWLRKLFDNLSSLVGAVFYTFFPYHLYDVYKRGSVGEVLSLSVLPFVLWQLEKKSLIWVSLGIAFLILAHNTLAVMFLPLVFCYMVLEIYANKKRRELMKFDIKVFVLGFGISSFFWLPALFDLQYTVFFKTQVSTWESYFSAFGLSGLSVLLVMLAVFIFITIKKIDIKKNSLTVLFYAVGLISIFLATPASYFIWKFLPVSFIQFPFRFLSLAVPSVSFLAAAVVFVLPDRKKLVMAGIILVLTFFSAKPYLFPESYQFLPDTFYSTNQDSTTVKNEYMPKWVKQIPAVMARERVSVLTGHESIQNLSANGNKAAFSLYSPEKSLIQFNTIYFPGWTVKVNGKEVPVSYNNNNGLIRFFVNPGNSNVNIFFSETPLRMFSDLLSLLSLVVLFALIIKDSKLSFKK